MWSDGAEELLWSGWPGKASLRQCRCSGDLSNKEGAVIE